MSASPTEFSVASLRLQPESDYHRTCRDLSIATATLELVAECGEVPADLRRLAEAAYLRLFDTADRLKLSKRNEELLWNQGAATSPAGSVIH